MQAMQTMQTIQTLQIMQTIQTKQTMQTMQTMQNMTHSQMFQKVEYGWGQIFKVALECLKRSSEPFLIYIYGIQCDFMPKSC